MPGNIKIHESFTIQRDTPSKCQIYNKWTVHDHKCLSSFLFLRFPSNWERERGYTKFGIRRHSPKGTNLISLMEFRGESFFFYGLIDFMLFLILAWRKWLLHVPQNFFVFFYPEYVAFGSVSYEPCPTTNFLIIYFRWREGVPTSVLGSQSIVWLLPSSFPCQATRVRSPSINIWSPLWPIFFLNGHSLMACYC